MYTIEEVVRKQAELSGGWVSFPFNAKCSCGYDHTQNPKSVEELISGCPQCHKSYCE